MTKSSFSIVQLFTTYLTLSLRDPAERVLRYACFKDHLHHFPIVLRTLNCEIRIQHLILIKNSLFSRRLGIAGGLTSASNAL